MCIYPMPVGGKRQPRLLSQCQWAAASPLFITRAGGLTDSHELISPAAAGVGVAVSGEMPGRGDKSLPSACCVNITSCDGPSTVLCSPGQHVYRAAVSGGWQVGAMVCVVAVGEHAAGACEVTVPIVPDVEGVGP